MGFLLVEYGGFVYGLLFVCGCGLCFRGCVGFVWCVGCGVVNVWMEYGGEDSDGFSWGGFSWRGGGDDGSVDGFIGFVDMVS